MMKGANFEAGSKIHPVFGFLQGSDLHRDRCGGRRRRENPSLISVFGEHRIDGAAPAGVVIFEQLFGRGARRAGYRE